MTQGTRAAMNPTCVPDSYEAIRPGERFKVRHFDVEPYPVPHDAADPVCYQVRVGGTAVGGTGVGVSCIGGSASASTQKPLLMSLA